MSRESVLARGRAFLTAGLVDTCRIEHVVAEDTNPVTAAVTKQYDVIYTGPCRIQAATANWAGPATVAEAALRLAAAELQLPVAGSEGISINDRVIILSCLHDTEMVNRVYAVTGLSHKSHATTRKLPLQEVLS
ncbi:MAG: DUF6093 family protein [Chloroflexota bacterium]